jgi:hypothetical protein
MASFRHCVSVFDFTQKHVYNVLKEAYMPTNLDLDDRLIGAAKKLGHHRTKKEAVNAALDEYIRRRKQLEILSIFGTIDYDENYNYKRERRKRS